MRTGGDGRVTGWGERRWTGDGNGGGGGGEETGWRRRTVDGNGDGGGEEEIDTEGGLGTTVWERTVEVDDVEGNGWCCVWRFCGRE